MRIIFKKEELNNLTVAELIKKFSELPLNAKIHICGENDYLLGVSEDSTGIAISLESLNDCDEEDGDVRVCEVCGEIMTKGFTTDDGSYYCCEKCFKSDMDRTYEFGWRPTNKEGIYGGLYEALGRNGLWEDTGIYYTEWE